MDMVGRPLDGWQQLIIMDAFALRPDNMWAAFELAVLVARQNGKGAVTEAIELAGLYLFHDRLIMHSAHLFKTAKNAFQRLVDIVNGSDWLMRRTQQIIRARGDEALILTRNVGGGRSLDYNPQLLCFARSGGSGRGFTGDKTIFDEAAYLTIDQYAAATPTMTTVPNPQVIYTATPPDEDVGPMPEDAMLPSVRKRGLAGEDRISLHEWSPADDDDPADPQVHRRCNPAYGIRIQPWFLAKQLANFTAAGKPGKFSTEHLGQWPPDAGAEWQVITRHQWNAAATSEPVEHSDVVLALDVTLDRRHCCLAVAGGRPDGDVGVAIVEHAAGTDWVVSRTVAEVGNLKPCRLVINAAGAAASLIPDIEAALTAANLDVEVVTPNARDEAAAYGMVYDALTRPEHAEPWRLWHRDDPRLTAAVAAGQTRKVGNEGTTWDWNEHAAPIKAVTHAVWGYVTRPVDMVPLVRWGTR
jgi:hypothetical protein